MLVLSRKVNEEITIGDDIRIMVIEVRGDKVRIGVDAPKDVPIHRKEIFGAIKVAADAAMAAMAAAQLETDGGKME